jgi:hypothetical protein
MDKDTLYELYVVQELSTRAIGSMYGVHNNTVCRALVKYGIPTRNRRDSHKTKGEVDRINSLSTVLGGRYGRLTVIGKEGHTTDGIALYLCKCDCGNMISVPSQRLTSGRTTSCGCYRSEVARANSTKHGYSGTRLYRIWGSMIQKCTNPNVPQYHYNGARDICVCEEWRDATNFINWANSHGYTDNSTLIRLDEKGDYTPNNCIWK